MKSAIFFQIDAFTKIPFKGNPAAVCFMPTNLDDKFYLSIAQEMNLSETAFVEEISKGIFNLRWFTPLREVPLCGHATLATGYAIFKHLELGNERVEFQTLSGSLYAERVQDGIRLNFPENKPFKIDPPEEVLEALGVTDWVDVLYSDTNQKLVVHLQNENDLSNISPDFGSLLKVKNILGWRGVIVTADGIGEYDFISRYFAPWMGINEDPVTGSSHTVLAPYWGEKLGKSSMMAYQASARGGVLFVELINDRVFLTGNCVTVVRGNLFY